MPATQTAETQTSAISSSVQPTASGSAKAVPEDDGDADDGNDDVEGDVADGSGEEDRDPDAKGSGPVRMRCEGTPEASAGQAKTAPAKQTTTPTATRCHRVTTLRPLKASSDGSQERPTPA